MKLDSDDFELFGLERRQAQSRESLDARWRALQAQVHPDKFASEGSAAQRLAVQWAVRVNEAYQRLKDPLRRAAYLCELQGAPIGAEDNTAMPPGFLAQQLEWREALEEAHTVDAVRALAREVEARQAVGLRKIESLLDDARDPSAAAAEVRALMFVERFAQDVERRLAALGQ
ncbi:MAG TPA: Fe-S protein assembly co-chaperone HscB [Caldimonas sp.]|nr:Fe-S protein assembly co-chaperone HscB [Caldimonas sp.]